jgi:hypothetical protein
MLIILFYYQVRIKKSQTQLKKNLNNMKTAVLILKLNNIKKRSQTNVYQSQVKVLNTYNICLIQ